MLPKEKRITKSKDYKRVYMKGSFFATQAVSANWLPNKAGLSRLGIVVTKKVEAKATKRNKLKRQFREVAKMYYEKLPIGFDVVISIKPKAKNMKFVEIGKELETVLSKVGK